MTLIAPAIPIEKEKKVMENDAAQVVRHLAHELRQPLSAMESLAFYLQMTLRPEDGKSRLQLAKIQQLIRQTSGIIDDAVHFLQAAPAHPVRVPLEELLARAIDEQPPERNITPCFHLPPGACDVWVDRAQAEHLTACLIRFVRQVCPPATPVEFSAASGEGSVEIRIEGPAGAMTESAFEESFEPFSLRSASGGLSLASAQRIAEAHRGSLTHGFLPGNRFSIRLRLPAAS